MAIRILPQVAPWLAFGGPVMAFVTVIAAVVLAILALALYGPGADINVPPDQARLFGALEVFTVVCFGIVALCALGLLARMVLDDFRPRWKLWAPGVAAVIAVTAGLFFGIWLVAVGLVVYMAWSLTAGAILARRSRSLRDQIRAAERPDAK